jgi:pyruvate dehydrogenase E2 component (dihydrolipoamide acetyltransferase)
VDITMPQLGETVTEGTITRWLKQVGERVDPDEPLFEVSTDKVDSEVPASAGGYLTEIRVTEGETAAVGTVLAVIGDAPATGRPAASQPDQPTESDVTRPSPVVSVAPAPPVASPAAPPSDPITAPLAAPVPAASSSPTPRPAAPPSGGVPLTSPIVRRLLASSGLDPAEVHGTGDGGRITRKDVQDATAASAAPPRVESPTPSPVVAPPSPPAAPAPAPVVAAPPSPPAAPAPAPVVAAPLAPAPAVVAPPGTALSSPAAPTAPRPGEVAVEELGDQAADVIEPFSNIRRRTAEHMVRSKATSAHVYTSVEVDFEPIARLRARNQDVWKQREGFSLTYLPFVARAFGAAVEQFPDVNASVGDQALVVHRRVNLGIAVDLDFQGLVAPVIRDADGKRLRLLAREIRDLATRARSKQLTPDEVLGATFTITNPGPYGTFMTLPIISQPQVAILSTDGVRKRPMVITGADGADVIAVRHTGILALTWDHRAFDGAYAAAFLGALKDDLETRNWEAELA